MYKHIHNFLNPDPTDNCEHVNFFVDKSSQADKCSLAMNECAY
jgi:hypothetical protein